MTTRVTEAAKTGEAAALVSCVSRLASRSFAAQRSRARALPLPNLKKRRDCSQSIYHMSFLATASLKKEQRVKNNVQ